MYRFRDFSPRINFIVGIGCNRPSTTFLYKASGYFPLGLLGHLVKGERVGVFDPTVLVLKKKKINNNLLGVMIYCGDFY